MSNISEFPVKITDLALSEAKKALLKTERLKSHFLRICVVGGGCSGLKYRIKIANDFDENDIVGEENEVKLAIDIFSAIQLNGATVDYLNTSHGSGFKFNNPNEEKSLCSGCNK